MKKILTFSLLFSILAISGQAFLFAETNSGSAVQVRHKQAAPRIQSAGEDDSFGGFFGNAQNPFLEMRLLQERMNRLFEASMSHGFGTPALSQFLDRYGETGFNPEADLEETNNAFLLELALPGFEKDSIDVQINGNTLTVSGKQERNLENEQENDQGRTYHVRETHLGSFERSFVVPGKFKEDQVSADYKNGVLKVTLPKADEKIQKTGRKIKIA